MSRKLSLLLLPLLLVIIGCGDATPQDEPAVDETALVLQAFDDYRNAVIGQKGEEAVKLIDQNTIDYYASMKEMAMEGERDAVDALQVVDKMMVLMLRHRIENALLTSMSPREIFVYAIDNGWTAKETVANLQLGENLDPGVIAQRLITCRMGRLPPWSGVSTKREVPGKSTSHRSCRLPTSASKRSSARAASRRTTSSSR